MMHSTRYFLYVNVSQTTKLSVKLDFECTQLHKWPRKFKVTHPDFYCTSGGGYYSNSTKTTANEAQAASAAFTTLEEVIAAFKSSNEVDRDLQAKNPSFVTENAFEIQMTHQFRRKHGPEVQAKLIFQYSK